MAGWEWFKRLKTGPKPKDRSPPAAPTTNAIPSGTKKGSEEHILEALRAVSVRNLVTLKDVALSGAKGEPIDDKTYLMERVIQLTAELPLNDRVSDTLTNNFLSELWHDLEHPPKSYLGYEFAFRKPDGSNNNILWPHVGASGQPYARSVRPRRMQPTSRPDPGVVFDSVLKRKEFRPHPNKISSILFYLASVIIHDCFHTSHTDFAISETSSYIDLAPLYGSNEDQQMRMRTKKEGKLKPDCFSDSRILGFPPGVGVLLIMFNRFHNHVASNLAEIDENGRFSKILKGQSGFKGIKPSGNKPAATPEELYDEAIFQTARLVTTGLYVNIVLKDYVRTILNLNRTDSLWNLDPRSDEGKAIFGTKIPEATGNQVAAEFNLVYRWHSCVSERDAKWTEDLMKSISKGQTDLSMGALLGALEEWNARLPKDPHERPFDSLKRQSDGRFSDDDLVEIWASGVEDVAGAFGAAHVPMILRSVEILGMIQARSWNLASLNEFREYFKLKPHETFESINPDPHVAEQLKRLYGHPDNVEIYPGIVVEAAKKSMVPGSGLAASFTTSRAILADAVSLVRSDRFYTVDYTPQNLTNWGFKAADYDLNINHGCVFYKLILNAFPNHLANNSIYAHYPLVVPGENKLILQNLRRDKLYNFEQPGPKPAAICTSSTTPSSAALTDSSKFETLWTGRLPSFGGPSQDAAVARTSFAEAFMANDHWKAVTRQYYIERLENLWKENQYELGGFQQVDLVGDVLNSAHVGFVTSILGIDKKSGNEKDGLLSTFSKVFDHAFGNPHPHGVNATVRDTVSWIASSIESQIHGSEGKESHTSHGALRQRAYAKLSGTGIGANHIVWQDVLPNSALLLNTLCRLSAQTAEFFLDDHSHLAEAPKLVGASVTDSDASLSQLAQEATRISGDVMVAKKACAQVNLTEGGTTVDASAGQVIFVNVSKAASNAEHVANPDKFSLDREEVAYSMEGYGPEIELAYQMAYMCNTVLIGIMGRLRGLERVPGPQGQLKRIKGDTGSVMYMNAEESEYVPYPTSMKVRWKI